MNLTQPPTGEPFPEPLAVAIRAFLTPRDKKILIAYYENDANEAELAAIFGDDAPGRVAQISRGVGKLLRLFNERERKARVSGSETSADVAENAEAARC
ncbi:MAG: hypothetical protein IJY15_06190 [Thermoguttaceae bacterium]|nr:hypothetical protein [Thermoguttaceae bacterium]